MEKGDHDHDQQEQLALQAEGMPEAVELRFDPAQRRAFGSVPGLLGKNLTIPSFEHLDQTALDRVTPEGLRKGLLGPQNRNAVDGIVLSPDEYTVIVRSPASFQAAIQAKTAAAGKSTNEIRAAEKEMKSAKDSFEQKWRRQHEVIKGLEVEKETLQTLLEWQRVPGFSRTSEVDIVALTNQAWNGTISNMLKTYAIQHELSVKEQHDMVNALAFKLFRGPQTDRVAHWGETLEFARSYTGAKLSLFRQRQQKVVRFGKKLSTELNDFYKQHGIFEI